MREQKHYMEEEEEKDDDDDPKFTRHVPRLPVIPDLRFEHSYLRSIRPYINIRRLNAEVLLDADDEEILREQGFEKVEKVEKGKRRKDAPRNEIAIPPREVIEVQWAKVFWITARDQLLSPLLQGALWALASYYIAPFSAQLGTKVGTFVHTYKPTKEGQGISWLRNWVRNLGIVSTSQPHS